MSDETPAGIMFETYQYEGLAVAVFAAILGLSTPGLGSFIALTFLGVIIINCLIIRWPLFKYVVVESTWLAWASVVTLCAAVGLGVTGWLVWLLALL